MTRAARQRVRKAADWPRYMLAKQLASGRIAYYWTPPKGCPVHAEALGQDYAAACDRAALLNAHLDAWRNGAAKPASIDDGARVGTVDWWLEHYRQSNAFKRLAKRTREDYADAMMRLADIETKMRDGHGQPMRLGALPVSSITPAAADKIYETLRRGGQVTRQANYAVDVARRAWKIVSRAYPSTFLIPNPDDPKNRIAINPWVGIDREYGTGTTTPATRAEAFALADALAGIGHPALGVAAIVAFELLQRPENIIAGHLAWSQIRPAARPREIEIHHHKTGVRIWHPLEIDDDDENGRPIVRQLYPELEAWLARTKRVGSAVVMLSPQRGARTLDGTRPARLYSESYADHLVKRARDEAGLPAHVTLAACRHGGMTLLGDAELTEQQIMTLSGHVTPAAARVYVKKTEAQRRRAAIIRRDHIDASARRTGTKRGHDLE